MNPIPQVDIISINFNSKKYLDKYLAAIRAIDYPKDKVHTLIIENNSYDGSRQYLEKVIKQRENISIIQNDTNEGFVANNIGMRVSNAEFIFLLNIDTEIHPQAITKLIEVMQGDDTIGICEARQSPHEHPKTYNRKTGETSWSSGACMMIRKKALKDSGVFDPVFYMYIEDIDISWRMWANNWKCAYVPDAVCIHHNFDPKDTKKPRFFEFYHVLRNGFFMRLIYGSWKDYLAFFAGMFWITFRSRGHSKQEKFLAMKAIIPQFMNFIHLLQRRRAFRKMPNYKSEHIKFYNIFDYNTLMPKPGLRSENAK